MEDPSREPRYVPRLLAFELLGDSRRFAFALKGADRWLQYLRQLAIERDSLQVMLLGGPPEGVDVNSEMLHLVACRSEFVTTDAAGGVGVFPLDRLRVSGVGVDVAAEFAS